MSGIPRKTQLVFGSGLVPSGNVANFGSLAANTPSFSNDPALIQTAAWANGISAALVGNRSLAIEDLNGILLTITQQLAYVLQNGIPEWDAGTTYWQKNIVRGVGTNVLFYSVTDGNVGHAVTDTNNWLPLAGSLVGPPVALAWVEFDGINATGGNANIINSFNVSSVTKLAGGAYTLNFNTALPSANYVLTGSCGTQNGNAYGVGDDGIVVGNTTGYTGVRSTTQCNVFTLNPTSKALVSPGCVSALIFGS